MNRWYLLSLVAMCGCTRNRMVGTIDGLQWPVGESYFVVDEEAYGDDGLLSINLTSLEDACRTWQLWDVLAEDAEDAEDLEDAWAEAFPKVFWEVHIGARIRPNGWPVGGFGWPGIAWDGSPEKPDVVFAEFIEHRESRTAAWFEAQDAILSGNTEDLDEDDLDDLEKIETVYRSNAGAVKWRSSTPDRIAKGLLTTDVVDDKGKRVGRVNAFFNATPCNTEPPLEVDAPVEDETTTEEEGSGT